MEHVVDLVKELSKGRCACYRTNGKFSLGYIDQTTGKQVVGHCDPGQLVKCLRCRAREALEADGVEYTKIDHVPVLMTL
jgi:hypothetical protein